METVSRGLWTLVASGGVVQQDSVKARGRGIGPMSDPPLLSIFWLFIVSPASHSSASPQSSSKSTPT